MGSKRDSLKALRIFVFAQGIEIIFVTSELTPSLAKASHETCLLAPDHLDNNFPSKNFPINRTLQSERNLTGSCVSRGEMIRILMILWGYSIDFLGNQLGRAG
jgi:hypothetical protein